MIKSFSLLLSLCFLLFVGYTSATESDDCCGRCTGSAYCTACKTCERCAHCSAGGSCGVCSGGSTPSRTHTRERVSSPESGAKITIPREQIVRPSVLESDDRKANKNALEKEVLFSGVVTTKSLNVRLGPSTSYAILTKLTLDSEIVYRLSTSADWYQVVQSDNADAIGGYVSAKYVQ